MGKDGRTALVSKRLETDLTIYLSPKLGHTLRVQREPFQLHGDSKLKSGLSWAKWDVRLP